MSHNTSAYAGQQNTPMPTFMDHFRELQGRIFAVAISFIVFSAAAYPFFDQITKILTAPLKPGQELVYLTPGGAFNFVIKVCLYIGAIFSLPIVIYNIYRFIMPAVKPIRMKTVLAYTIASFVLAVIGMVFAYVVSLPAALYFLTSFNLSNIQAMLTIDSYFSFVMTYLLAGAVLFQLPLVMLIINSVSPLKTKRLMSYQRHIIVGSFVVAAIISPTPDALNQILLASPVIIMYQVGIALIWLKNRKHRRTKSVDDVIESSTLSGSYSDATMEHASYLTALADELAPKPVPASASPRHIPTVSHTIAKKDHRQTVQVRQGESQLPGAASIPKTFRNQPVAFDITTSRRKQPSPRVMIHASTEAAELQSVSQQRVLPHPTRDIMLPARPHTGPTQQQRTVRTPAPVSPFRTPQRQAFAASQSVPLGRRLSI